MASAQPDSLAPGSQIAIERRPNDFESAGPIRLCHGSSCCCCLHWVGAVAGGAIGLPVGLITARKRRRYPLHPKAKKALGWGMFAGFLLTPLVIALLAGVPEMRWLGGALMFVPSLIFVPVGCCMLLATWCLKRSQPPHRDTGADSPAPRVDYGVGTAWRAAWVSFVLASLLSGLGYLIMFAFL